MPTSTPALIEDREGAVAVLESFVDERRLSTRLPRAFTAEFTRMGSTEPCACTAEDISEGGVYLRVPVSSGISVGERCEVLLTDPLGSNSFAGYASASCFATVVRTDTISAANEGFVGAGLRFDQPLFL